MENMKDLQGKDLGFHVSVRPDTLIVDFDEIREETIERFGFAEKPADEPWIVGKLSREDFFRMKEEEEEEENRENQ